MDDDLAVLVWGVRLLLLGLTVAVLAVLALAWWVVVVPVVREALRARATGDWWLPWVRRPDGTWGPLTGNRWWSAFRAERRGGGGALAVRWGFWGVQATLLALGTLAAAIGLVALVATAWP